MTTELPPSPTLGDELLEKLRASPHPLTLKEAAKGVAKRKKEKPAELADRVRAALAEGMRARRVFSAPSGKKGETRYWSRDERYLLRERGVQLAEKPQALKALTTKLAKEVKGADKGYVEAQLRDLIGDGYLHEHAAKKGPLFGSTPPPPPLPPLEQGKHPAALRKLLESCFKLAKAAGVGVDEVLATLRAKTEVPAAKDEVEYAAPPTEAERLILAAVERDGVMSLADLRREMPAEYRGRAFDETVLRLEGEQRVILHRDADPVRFSDAERADLVQDGASVFTTIGKRG